MMNNLSSISNNVKGIQAISKQLKIFEYLKNYITSHCFIFLQETHSSNKDGVTNSKGSYFNSCGVAIRFVGTMTLNILNIRRDDLGRILVIGLKIDDFVSVVINIYNANVELKQLHSLNDLINILKTFEDI